jgi:hypothetical protein
MLLVFLISSVFAQDTDEDGLQDEYELELGTDLNNMDTDSDKYSDGVEVQIGSDPLNAKSVPMDNISGFSVSDIPVKNYIVAILIITIISQIIAYNYLRKHK